jgi:hypothetical protein
LTARGWAGGRAGEKVDKALIADGSKENKNKTMTVGSMANILSGDTRSIIEAKEHDLLKE